VTITRLRAAIAKLHWGAVMDKKADTAWIRALCNAAKTIKKLDKAAA
jgi:hypothetical protein